MTPEQVLEKATADLPDGAYITTAVVLVEYAVPGAEDEDGRGPFLSHAYSEGGVWRVLGMLDLMTESIRRRSAEFYQPGDD